MSSSPELEELYFKFGNQPYAIGEDVTQLEHGLQGAESAEKLGYNREFILACLLHDIGHLIGARDGLPTMGDLGTANHEAVGADWLLSHGFSEYTSELVRHHTTAKRYMSAVDSDYVKRLSIASLNTLRIQGGPMTQKEQADFVRHPYFHDFIRIRSFDDGAKVETTQDDLARQTARWQHFFQ